VLHGPSYPHDDPVGPKPRPSSNQAGIRCLFWLFRWAGAVLLCIRYNEVPHSNKPGITQACYNEVLVNSGPSHPHDDPGAQTTPHHLKLVLHGAQAITLQRTAG
jgi:hypothetical protein